MQIKESLSGKATLPPNTKLYDSSSKIIFEDNLLCSQFLRDYIDLAPLNIHVESKSTHKRSHFFGRQSKGETNGTVI